MVDLVKQLREDSLTAHADSLRVMCGWGADEIERLRAELLVRPKPTGAERYWEARWRDEYAEKERLLADGERQLAEWTRRLTAQASAIEQLRGALDAFATATGMQGGPSLAVQRHDPSWAAWKKLCDAAQQTAGP